MLRAVGMSDGVIIHHQNAQGGLFGGLGFFAAARAAVARAWRGVFFGRRRAIAGIVGPPSRRTFRRRDRMGAVNVLAKTFVDGRQ